MSDQRRQSSDDSNTTEVEDLDFISASPSILRDGTPSRQPVSGASSVVISLPDESGSSLVGESPEQRHLRRIRFLEMRREHYSQMHQHTEQCTMSDDEEQEFHHTSPPGREDTKKPK